MRTHRTTMIAVSLALVAGLGCGPSAPEPILGVRLGMTPPQVRERFGTAVRGSFRSEAMGEDLVLVWTPDEPDASVRSARHEFHLGQLVAMRLVVDPSAPMARGPAMELTEVSILTREPGDDGVEVTWLARSCPTHADEVERRIREHQ